MKKHIVVIPIDAINDQERIRTLIRQKMRLMDMDLSAINRFECDCFAAPNADVILDAAAQYIEVRFS